LSSSSAVALVTFSLNTTVVAVTEATLGATLSSRSMAEATTSS
jgi:uncharacterized MnhB-related membrane protein